MRHGPLRSLHRASRRQGHPFLRFSAFARRRQARHHDRRSFERPFAPSAACLDRNRRPAMRLLPVWADHECRHLAERKFQAHRQRHRRSHVRQHLPLRNLPAHPPRYSPRRRNGRGKEVVMSRLEERNKAKLELSGTDSSNFAAAKSSRIARRDFLKTTAAIGGGLCIAAHIPELAAHPDSNAPAGATVFAPNAFVRIAPDDTVTVISNHSEMGQGIYTSLPMLLNEELQADWSKIRVEPAPVDAVYNHTLYGVQMTGGS